MADDVLILIPARMASTRLPGKPLADIAGLPMIVQVLRRAEAAQLGPVVVACDDETIATAVEKAGGRAILTRADHPSGSDRIFEALGVVDPKRRASTIVNFQGDMPTLEPASLRAAVKLLENDEVDIATLAADLRDIKDWLNPNIVKVGGSVSDATYFTAKIFSRKVAPEISTFQNRDTALTAFVPGAVYNFAHPSFFHHIGLYAYRRAALERFVGLPPSKNEQREQLEQLRAMDDGMRIDVAIVDTVPLGVDTPEDLETARALLR
jgi:3-deoxy-manno-octulosonate cytidylyltransferase (CMP-KDO synthetase)